MASHKNQHFVPKCYLRPFTVDGLGTAISLFNVDRQRFIHNAPVKNQCSRDYFYGKDLVLERKLQTIEGDYARLLAQIHAPNFALNDEAKALLCVFWAVQHIRTEAASRRVAEMNNGMAHSVGAPAEYRLSIEGAVELAMGMVGDSVLAIADLKVALVRNRTALPFVTSDDPAILTNRWHFGDLRTRGRAFGLGKAGTLLLLPLSPRVICVFYDGDVYSLPHSNGWTDATQQVDVQAFNEHQLLNCWANIYFADWPGRTTLSDELIRVAARRPGIRHRLNFAVFDREENGARRYVIVNEKQAAEMDDVLIHSEVISAQPSGWPTMLRWRQGGHVYTNGTGLGYVRRARATAEGQAGFRKFPI